MTTRAGIGLDAHRFEDGRPLMLGCVEIPYRRGLAGHSDGDVVAHAICDAALGAAGLGDIGDLFPAEPRYAGASGAALLAETVRVVSPNEIIWVDVTVVCAEPRLSSHRDAMRKAVAEAMSIDPARVSVKATTTDDMGFTGRNEGVAAIASVTIEGSLEERSKQAGTP